jgi:hypothetical protein
MGDGKIAFLENKTPRNKTGLFVERGQGILLFWVISTRR